MPFVKLHNVAIKGCLGAPCIYMVRDFGIIVTPYLYALPLLF